MIFQRVCVCVQVSVCVYFPMKSSFYFRELFTADLCKPVSWCILEVAFLVLRPLLLRCLCLTFVEFPLVEWFNLLLQSYSSPQSEIYKGSGMGRGTRVWASVLLNVIVSRQVLGKANWACGTAAGNPVRKQDNTKAPPGGSSQERTWVDSTSH